MLDLFIPLKDVAYASDDGSTADKITKADELVNLAIGSAVIIDAINDKVVPSSGSVPSGFGNEFQIAYKNADGNVVLTSRISRDEFEFTTVTKGAAVTEKVVKIDFNGLTANANMHVTIKANNDFKIGKEYKQEDYDVYVESGVSAATIASKMATLMTKSKIVNVAYSSGQTYVTVTGKVKLNYHVTVEGSLNSNEYISGGAITVNTKFGSTNKGYGEYDRIVMLEREYFAKRGKVTGQRNTPHMFTAKSNLDSSKVYDTLSFAYKNPKFDQNQSNGAPYRLHGLIVCPHGTTTIIDKIAGAFANL